MSHAVASSSSYAAAVAAVAPQLVVVMMMTTSLSDGNSVDAEESGCGADGVPFIISVSRKMRRW